MELKVCESAEGPTADGGSDSLMDVTGTADVWVNALVALFLKEVLVFKERLLSKWE